MLKKIDLILIKRAANNLSYRWANEEIVDLIDTHTASCIKRIRGEVNKWVINKHDCDNAECKFLDKIYEILDKEAE